MSSDQMPAPGKIKLIKFPPPGQEKTSNDRGMPGGDVEASIWLIHYALFPQRNFLQNNFVLLFFISYNKSFIDQGCSVKMARYCN